MLLKYTNVEKILVKNLTLPMKDLFKIFDNYVWVQIL